MGFVRTIVPYLSWLSQVVVGFTIVRAVVTCLAQILWTQFHSYGHRHHGTHVQAAAAGWVHTGDDRSAGWSTHGGDRPSLFENHPLNRKRIDVRRPREFVAVTTHLRTVVFAGNPKDVRVIGSRHQARRVSNENECQYFKKQKSAFHFIDFHEWRGFYSRPVLLTRQWPSRVLKYTPLRRQSQFKK